MLELTFFGSQNVSISLYDLLQRGWNDLSTVKYKLQWIKLAILSIIVVLNKPCNKTNGNPWSSITLSSFCPLKAIKILERSRMMIQELEWGLLHTTFCDLSQSKLGTLNLEITGVDRHGCPPTGIYNVTKITHLFKLWYL